MPTSQNVRYVPAIDHLRAYAATLVLLYHSVHLVSYRLLWGAPFAFDHWPTTWNPVLALIYEGHTGVSLFMVLSGFIFTHGAAGGEIHYPTFLRNRVLRIYPLMLVLTFVGISAFPERFALMGLVQTLLPLQNLPGSLPLGPYNSLFWTIAVEFQFYLIFPFLHRRLLRKGVRALLAIIAFSALARWSAVLLGGNPRDLAYWTILGRLDQFLIGMIAADWLQRFRPAEGGRTRWWLLPAGVGGEWLALFAFHRQGGWPEVAAWKILWPTVEAAFWAMVVVGYVALRQGRDGFVSRLLAGVGAISYSMYLLHLVVITVLLDHRWFVNLPGHPRWSAALTGVLMILPITLAAALLSYRVVEKPFLDLRRRHVAPGGANPA